MTAGTILHGSKLDLTIWFWAAYLMATHSNGMSALQLQKQLGLGSYRSAWMLAAKLRRAIVDPDRNPLSGLVEIDESSLPFRTKEDPPASGAGRSHEGKMLVVGSGPRALTAQFPAARSQVSTPDPVWPRARTAALEARDRAACGPVCPPQGRYLAGVGYPEDPFSG